MSKLNKDVLFLILKELHNHGKSLYSCLLVDRTWCKSAVPILWKNPRQYCITNDSRDILFKVILSHLSKESRDILKNQEINLFTKTYSYQQPSFNYISFWKYLSLWLLESMVVSIKNIEKTKMAIVTNEILKLFIRNTKIIHLCGK